MLRMKKKDKSLGKEMLLVTVRLVLQLLKNEANERPLQCLRTKEQELDGHQRTITNAAMYRTEDQRSKQCTRCRSASQQVTQRIQLFLSCRPCRARQDCN